MIRWPYLSYCLKERLFSTGYLLMMPCLPYLPDLGRKKVIFFFSGGHRVLYVFHHPISDWLGTLVNMALFGNWFHPNPEDKIMIFPYFPQSIFHLGIFLGVYRIIRHSQFLWVSSWLYSFKIYVLIFHVISCYPFKSLFFSRKLSVC